MSLLASSQKTSRKSFEKHADFYDSSVFINNYLNKWDQEIINMNLPRPLLDLGCGPGRLLSKLRGNGERYGLDLTLAGLKIARGKFGEQSENTHFAEGLLEELPYKSNSFNSTVISGVFHHLEKPEIALSEVSRIIKDTGLLIIADPYFPPLMRQFINGVLSFYPITGDRRFYTASQVENLALKHGFVKKGVLEMPLAYILTFEKCCN